jgi:hypothetical protein
VLRLAAAAAVAAVIALPQPAAAAVPLPDNDPFYAVPSDIAQLPNGSVLKSRQIAVNAYSIPLPVKAWQLQYKSLDSRNQPTADVTTVMVPLAPWLGKGPRPLLSYQTAEDGVGTKCAPSYALRAGLVAGPTNSALEAGLMALALQRGWAVAAPDYEGPHSTFLGAGQSAHGVLDGLRAALTKFPSNTPVGMIGYSGGAFATSVAAQTQPSYAPELTIAGVALGGVPADIEATTKSFDITPLGGAIIIGVIGLDRAHPDANLKSVLNDKGKQAYAASAKDCINDAVLRHPGAKITDFSNPGAFDLPWVKKLMRDNSPLGLTGVPSAPVYDYHAILDELAPIGPDRQLVARFCAAGLKVQHVEHVLAEHVTETVTAAPGALQYLSDRFARIPPPSTC